MTWSGGSWSRFGDPRAVQVGGFARKTFVGWIDWNGGVTIADYDPRGGPQQEYVVARVYHDDHSDPSILVEPDAPDGVLVES